MLAPEVDWVRCFGVYSCAYILHRFLRQRFGRILGSFQGPCWCDFAFRFYRYCTIQKMPPSHTTCLVFGIVGFRFCITFVILLDFFSTLLSRRHFRLFLMKMLLFGIWFGRPKEGGGAFLAWGCSESMGCAFCRLCPWPLPTALRFVILVLWQ